MYILLLIINFVEFLKKIIINKNKKSQQTHVDFTKCMSYLIIVVNFSCQNWISRLNKI